MEPHHHVHISTGFLFVLMLAIVALIVAVGFAIYLARKPKVIERVERVSHTRFIEPEAEDRPYVRSVSSVGAFSAPPRQVDSTVARSVRPVPLPEPRQVDSTVARSVRPVPLPEPRQHHTQLYVPPAQSDRLFEGILLGELMGSSHGSTTVIESTPSYQSPSDNFSSGSDSGGFSYDSGSSSSDSGGFDCSW